MKQPSYGAHIPWAQVEQQLSFVLSLGLTPEFAIKGPDLDELDQALLDRVALTLAKDKIRPFVHAPFFDLNIGALDPEIRKISQKRLLQALAFADRLNAALMVVHPGVDKWRYPNLDHAWLAIAKVSFGELSEQAGSQRCHLAIENIYEESPELLVKLVTQVDSEWFGHCFDVGHWNLFGKGTMEEWLAAILPRLLHLHLHDNHGLMDEHLPVGQGAIDFTPLQVAVKRMRLRPSMTLEAHSQEHLEQSLQQVRALEI